MTNLPLARFRLATFTSGLLLALPASGQAEPVRVGIYANPPKLMLDDQGQPGGILGDLLSIMAEREGWQLEAFHCDWQAGAVSRVMLAVKLPLRDLDGSGVSLCGISTDITDYRAIQARNHRLANYNPVTGLPNRHRLVSQLEQATSAQRPHDRHEGQERHGALLLLDLDRFKLVNDLHSNKEGDRLLQRIAEELEKALAESGFLAHLGSDEFAILIDDLDPPLDEAAHRVEKVAEILLEVVASIASLDDAPSTTASIGMTLFSPGRADAGSVMQQVDMALAQAKSAGGNTLRFFSEEIHRRVMARVRMEQELQQALAQDELKVDRSFVTGVFDNASDAAIVETTLTLAASLGLDVVAEGVEQVAQLEWLASRGCQAFQGFHFGRPQPLEALMLDGE